MALLIGMDEAGYGPNLGPLVVAATAWEVAAEDSRDREQGAGNSSPQSLHYEMLSSTVRSNLATSAVPSSRHNKSQWHSDTDFYRRLRQVVAKSPSERRIAIADSKMLYKPGSGLRQLERGIHAVLSSTKQTSACWSTIVESCGADPDQVHRRLPWHDRFNCPLPVDATDDELTKLCAKLARVCTNSNLRPIAIRARLVFPAEFNELVEYHGTKGAALSNVTIGLLREVMDSLHGDSALAPESNLPSESPAPNHQPPIYVLCDKHGGRNFYGGLLQHHFSEHWIEPLFESRDESNYAWGPENCRVQVTFRTRGEAFLPTALASMMAKYLRELSMRAFNEFWCARLPGLRPTAGYPSDAPRFKRAIAPVQHELGIDDHLLWRIR